MTQVTIGELLRRHRLAAELTQKEIATKIGYHHSFVSRIERNSQIPNGDYVALFCHALALEDTERQELLAALSLAAPTQTNSEFMRNRINWGIAPDTSVFYGRSADLDTLTQWVLADHCHLIGILGMGGIGKTSLTAKLARQIQRNFEYIIWHSLATPSFLDKLLSETVSFLSDYKISATQSANEKQIATLLQLLHHKRCLLILDNFESTLQPGQASLYQTDYADYSKLIHYIGTTEHQSCLIFTSREKPPELSQLEGVASPVRSYQLTGLDVSSSQQILWNKKLTGSDIGQAQLVNYYLGNPLALEIVSEMIREIYDGNIMTFLSDGVHVFGRVQDVIQEQFDRLSPLEKSVMLWLAIEREPVSLNTLSDAIVEPVSKRDLVVALRSLRRRSLLEKQEGMFMLQNVIMEFVTDYLITAVCTEIQTRTTIHLNHHALIKADAPEYVRQAQIQFILHPIATRLQRIYSKPELVHLLQEVLVSLRTTPMGNGYAAGNIINLLIQLGISLQGFDFSQLIVRQAFLQDIELCDVDLSGTNLVECVFLETFGHVLSVATSPITGLLAAATADGNIHIWQAGDNKPLYILEADTNWVRSIAFSSDGQTIVSGSSGRSHPSLQLWNVETGQHLQTLLGHTNRIRAVSYHPGGKIVASASEDHTVRLWDTQTGECLQVLQGHEEAVWSIAFSGNGRFLASASVDQTVRLWDVATGKNIRILHGHTDWVSAVVFSRDSNLIISGSRDKTVRLWEIKSGQCSHVLEGHTDWVRTIAVSPDGQIIASGSGDKTIRLWTIHFKQCIGTLQGHDSLIESIAFSSDGSHLVSGGADQTIRLWNTITGQCFKTMKGYSNPTWSLSFSPDDRYLATGSSDGEVRIWDLGTNQCIHTLKGHRDWAKSVAFSPDGQFVASGSSDKTLRLWDANTGQCLHILHGHTAWVSLIAFSSNGRFLASSSGDQTIRVWDTQTGRCHRILEGHTSRVWAVVFSPTEQNLLISSGDDGTIRLWDIDTGVCRNTLAKHTGSIFALAINPQGNLIASGGNDKELRFWEAKTGQVIFETQEETTLWALAFSLNGAFLAGSFSDHTVKIWDTDSGQPLKVLEGHTKPVWCVTFSHDGEYLASCGDDEVIRFWDIQSGDCIKTLQADRPYERMNITNTNGLTQAQRKSVKDLGAIEDPRYK